MLVLPVIPFPAINPVLISIGPFAVRWYALAYIVGIIAGWLYARAIIASERLWGGRAPFTVTSPVLILITCASKGQAAKKNARAQVFIDPLAQARAR